MIDVDIVVDVVVDGVVVVVADPGGGEGEHPV